MNWYDYVAGAVIAVAIGLWWVYADRRWDDDE